MNETVAQMIQFAPAVAALLWIVYKQDKRLDELTSRILEMVRDCDCNQDPESD